MSEEQNNQTPTPADRQTFRLSDDLIGMVRELIQLALLTGTNIVDHMRALVVEVGPDGRSVTITPEYVESYNQMILQLNAQAEQRMRETQEALAGGESSSDA